MRPARKDRRPPRPAGEKILDAYFIWRIAFVSVLIGGMALIMRIGMAVFLVVKGEKTFMRKMDARRSKHRARADAGGKDPCDI